MNYDVDNWRKLANQLARNHEVKMNSSCCIVLGARGVSLSEWHNSVVNQLASRLFQPIGELLERESIIDSKRLTELQAQFVRS